MRLFYRVFLSHLAAALVTSVALTVTVGLVSPTFYRMHLERLVRPTPAGLELREVLSSGHQHVMLLAFLASLPLAVSLAALTAFFESRRVAVAVSRLARANRELARGHYQRRLEVRGRDELATLADDFNQMAGALEKHERRRSAFVDTVAHELRTPLSALQGYSEALSDRLMTPADASMGIERELRALRRLTDDLLLVSRLDAQTVALRCAAYSPCDLLHDALDRFLTAFEEEGIELRLQAATDLSDVWADWERVSQVLANLLNNALRHTPRGGQVTLGAAPLSQQVRFFVRDSGPGIGPEHQPHVFEPFYRVDASRSRQGGGSGIGLTIARGLVAAMGGELGLESEFGVGSSFSFTLLTAGQQRLTCEN